MSESSLKTEPLVPFIKGEFLCFIIFIGFYSSLFSGLVLLPVIVFVCTHLATIQLHCQLKILLMWAEFQKVIHVDIWRLFFIITLNLKRFVQLLHQRKVS